MRAAFLHIHRAAGAGIERAFRSLSPGVGRPGRGGNLGQNLFAGAEARIDQVFFLQPAQRMAVFVHMLRLAAHRKLPAQPQPGQIVFDGGTIFRAAAGAIDIFDAQQKAPAVCFRRPFRIERRKCVAQMQMPRRRGGEAGDGWRHLGELL